jgi:hypothetical protein
MPGVGLDRRVVDALLFSQVSKKWRSRWHAIGCGSPATIVLLHLTFVGVARQADEGAEAHLCQLLMVGQIPVVAFFVLTRLARDPASALRVLGVQAAAALAAMAPVYLLRW